MSYLCPADLLSRRFLTIQYLLSWYCLSYHSQMLPGQELDACLSLASDVVLSRPSTSRMPIESSVRSATVCWMLSQTYFDVGQYRMINGQLQSTSLDCYIAMELSEDGDLFNLKWASHGILSDKQIENFIVCYIAYSGNHLYKANQNAHSWHYL